MSHGIGCRCGLDLMLLWLWCRQAAAVPIRLLAWEPPYAMGVALKRQKDKKTKKSLGEGKVVVLERQGQRDRGPGGFVRTCSGGWGSY